MGVITRRRAVACSVALSSRLDPDDGINQRVAGVRSGLSTESGALDVAPVTPGGTNVLYTGTALVDDELGGETSGVNDGGECLRSQG